MKPIYQFIDINLTSYNLLYLLHVCIIFKEISNIISYIIAPFHRAFQFV